MVAYGRSQPKCPKPESINFILLVITLYQLKSGKCAMLLLLKLMYPGSRLATHFVFLFFFLQKILQIEEI